MLKPTLVHIQTSALAQQMYSPLGQRLPNSFVLIGVLMKDYAVAILCTTMRDVWNCFIHYGYKDFNFIPKFLRIVLS